ncbi:MAG: FAD:protein FMN transferase [Pseudomonadota bacterium]
MTSKQKSHSREWLFCLLLVSLLGCQQRPDVVKLTGPTMGTIWHVTYVSGTATVSEREIAEGISQQLEAVNSSMSTYRDGSEINRINAAPEGDWIALSPSFAAVLSTALAVGSASRGAYDVTVGPLVDLWGFGPEGAVTEVPGDDSIRAMLGRIGHDQLEFEAAGQRLRKRGALELDFSSLAKGYGVDRISDWLLAQGVGRFLVEVGGEIRTAGLSGRGDLWRVAIEQPEAGARNVAATVALRDLALATSGDYRNFFTVDGVQYSHTIDPRSGYPIDHPLVSVTVAHPSGMFADAWATALLALGEEAEAVALAQALAVYFIHRSDEGYEHSYTPEFAPLLVQADGSG